MNDPNFLAQRHLSSLTGPHDDDSFDVSFAMMKGFENCIHSENAGVIHLREQVLVMPSSQKNVGTTPLVSNPLSTGNAAEADEGVGSRIRFLQEKQSVLSKANSLFSREQAYNAAQAVEEVSATVKRTNEAPSIWDEAKALLNTTSSKKVNKKHDMMPPPPRKKSKTANPCDPSIDLSSVEWTKAKDFTGRKRNEAEKVSMELNVTGCDWVTNALLQMSSGTWKVCFDSENEDSATEGSTAMGYLLPPPSSNIHGITLEQALEITAEPRCLIQALPPFIVVYANRAYPTVDVGLSAVQALPSHPSTVTVCPVVNDKKRITHLLIRA